MYIIGHLATVIESNSFDSDQVAETGVRALMLPDYADTHAFAYINAWNSVGDIDSRLVRAHIAGDWWVHFGDDLSKPARREGWAYRRMGIVARKYDAFFARAYELGLATTSTPNDSRRGWAHSMLEYSIDTFAARCGRYDSLFETTHGQLASLQLHGEQVRRLFELQQRDPWSQEIWSNACDYSARVAFSQTPEDLAILGAVGKFGLSYSPESVDLVRSYQSHIVESIDSDEYERILSAMAEFVAAVDETGLTPSYPGGPAKSDESKGL